MFDSLGNTGGCQAPYTVIPPLSTPNCSNVTFPPLLDVQATDENGPLSQFGWIDQCTDISILPKNGTAPYTLTIAPSLHPPYNITSNDMSSINWTDSLNYASEFYVGLYDSAGNMWSNGPLHSGSGGTTGCLAGQASHAYNDDQIDAVIQFTFSSGLVQPAIAIGAGVGGLVIGLLIGLSVPFLLIRRYYKRKMQAGIASLPGSPSVRAHANLPGDFQYIYKSIPTSGISHPVHVSEIETPSGGLHRLRPLAGSLQYHIERFVTVMPDENGHLALADEVRSSGHTVTTPPPEPVSSVATPQQQSHVYVLHHDNNIPPVTIYHESGTEIVGTSASIPSQHIPERYA